MERFVVKIGAEELSPIPVPMQTADTESLCALLQTDVFERLRVPQQPSFFAGSGKVLCYFIDGRGGEKHLPANLCGTCFYHTGCPIYGDLILLLCGTDMHDTTLCGMSRTEADALCKWLREQFAFLH